MEHTQTALIVIDMQADYIGEKSPYHYYSNELIGIDGNCCVASSAIEASKRGFAVTFPLDYIGIKDKERFCKTKAKLIKANVEIVEM